MNTISTLPSRMSAAGIALLLSAALVVAPMNALAWGRVGHRTINRLAVTNLPTSVPAFVRSANARAEIAALGPEEDYLKGAGRSWDADHDSGHFLDLGDNGTVAGVIRMNDLPPTMSAYAQALAGVGTNPYKVGYLPYRIMDGFERLRMDFAYWRAFDYQAVHAKSADARAAFESERNLRQTLILRDIGDWGHFVADGSQPLHVTIHYNGWGRYPNPNHFSTSHRIHAMFESQFVAAHITAAEVQRYVTGNVPTNPQRLLSQSAIAAMVGAYLTGSSSAVPRLYSIEKSGGFRNATPQAVDFTAQQLARGASMLRNLIALAWEDSLNESVDYPAVKVRAVLNGSVMLRP